MSKQVISQEISALILSGGLARRMDGVDKGFVELQGKPMIQHVLDNLGFDASRIMINTDRAGEEYLELGCVLVADKLTGHLGPLAGIHAGLCESTTQYVFVVPCDTPYIDMMICERLYAELRASKATIAVAHDGLRMQATVAVIDISVREALARYIQQGGRRMMSWYKEQAALEVDCADLRDCFININTLEELKVLQQKENNKCS